MKIKNLVLLLPFLIFLSCSDDNNITSDQPAGPSEIYTSDIYIDREPIDIDTKDVDKIGFLFGKKELNIQTKSTNSSSIKTVTDSLTGKPILYIMNYGNNNGFVVISATKKYAPILAFSEIGSFDEKIDLASKEYLTAYKYEIIETLDNPSDSLRIKHAAEWSYFENPDIAIKKNSSTLDKKKQAEIEKKKSQGYRYVGGLEELKSYIPASEYQSAINDICTHTDRAYNCNEISLFFIKDFSYTQIGPLTQTEWNQGYPFNVDAPNGFAGCVPIALAQIAYFHKYPAKYNWNNIYTYPILNSDFKYFIKDIRDLCKVNYGPKGTGSTYEKAMNAARSLGYKAEDLGLPDFIKLQKEITNGRPVYIQGENDETGHAWICSGYQFRRSMAIVSTIFDWKYDIDGRKDQYGDYNIMIADSDAMSEYPSRFFYMNMGWGDSNNGWYRSNTYNDIKRYNFLKNQKMMRISK